MSKVTSANEDNYAKIGEVYTNNQGCEYVIIKEISKKKVRIKFLDEYGYEKDIDTYTIKRQNGVLNPYVKNKGKGCTGNIKGLNVKDKERNKWKNLLVLKTVCYKDEWNCLEFFVKDLRNMNIENYDEWLNAGSKEKVFLNAIIENGEIVGFEVSKESSRAKRVVIKSMFNGEEEEFKSIADAAEELGYIIDTISKYCKQEKVVDGYKYFFK